MFTFFSHNNKGDTIVEVLIAMVIMALLLAGAYVLTNSSTLTERNSQENSEALTLAQSQIEALRTTSGLSAPDNCFNNAGTAITTGCSFNNDWSPCTSPPATYCYNVKVTPPSSNTIPPPPTYTITVSWAGPNGGQDQVQLYYQWYGGQGAAALDNPDTSCYPDDYTTLCPSSSCPATAYSVCYDTQVSLQNISPQDSENTAANIASCTWSWDDGSPSNTYYPSDPDFTSCLPKGYSPLHNYCTGVTNDIGVSGQVQTCANTVDGQDVQYRLEQPFPGGCWWNNGTLGPSTPQYVPTITITYKDGTPPVTSDGSFSFPMILCSAP